MYSAHSIRITTISCIINAISMHVTDVHNQLCFYSLGINRQWILATWSSFYDVGRERMCASSRDGGHMEFLRSFLILSPSSSGLWRPTKHKHRCQWKYHIFNVMYVLNRLLSVTCISSRSSQIYAILIDVSLCLWASRTKQHVYCILYSKVNLNSVIFCCCVLTISISKPLL